MKKLGPIIGTASGLGVTMGLSAAGLVVLGLLGGRWLDARLGTSPVATILCLVAGAIAAQVALYRLALSSRDQLAETNRLRTRALVVPALSIGLRLLLVMVGPGLAGLLIGLLLTRFTGTPSWLMIALTLFGFGAGLFGVTALLRHTATRTDHKTEQTVETEAD